MPVTDLLERNHKLYGEEVALVELNPTMKDTRKTTWKEYDLVQQTSSVPYRREITWSVFDEKANRVANMLLSRGVQKGDRVAILMFNCLEWLPIYFGLCRRWLSDIRRKLSRTCSRLFKSGSVSSLRRRRRCSNLFFFRNNRISESNPS